MYMYMYLGQAHVKMLNCITIITKVKGHTILKQTNSESYCTGK